MRGDTVEEPAVVADDHGAARVIEQGLLERAERVDVEVVGWLVEQQQVRAALQQLGEVHAIALAARQGADLPLLLRPLEVEPGDVGTRGDRPLADHQLVLAAGDLLPDALVGRERVAALVHVPVLHRLTQPQRSGIRLLLPGDHPEQGRLPGAIRPDHADDAATRQREVQVVDEELIAVRLSQPPRLDDEVAKAGTRRNVDFNLFDLLRAVLVEQLFVGVETRLALRLPRTGRHADPLELARQRLLALALGLLFQREPLLLLLQPRRVVSLPRDAGPAIELENPLGGVVEEVAVVRDGDDGALVFLQEALEPRDRLRVEMVGRLVEQQQVGRLEQQAAQRDAAPLAARERRDVRVGRRAAERIHRELELRVDVPRIHGVDAVLQAPLLLEQLVHRLGRHVLAELHVQLVVPIEQRLDLGDALLDVPLDVLARVEPRLLRQEADGDAVGRERLADELVILARHDLQQRALARAVQPEHADFRAGKKRQPDVFENDGVGRVNLPEPLHCVDVLHAPVPRYCDDACFSGSSVICV